MKQKMEHRSNGSSILPSRIFRAILVSSSWVMPIVMLLSAVKGSSAFLQSRNAAFLSKLPRHHYIPRPVRLHAKTTTDASTGDDHSGISAANQNETGDMQSASPTSSTKRSDRNVGGYDPSERIGGETVNVGDPQLKVEEKEFSVTSILRELAAIQQEGPRKYCILGTRHCSFLHQQIIELLAYALVLSGNHVYTSGAGGTHSATIKGALRAERSELLTVVLPQSLCKQPSETQTLLEQVEDVIEMPQNNEMSLDIASRICNSYLLSLTDQLISFAFHESTTVIEATKEAKDLDMLVTVLYLD